MTPSGQQRALGTNARDVRVLQIVRANVFPDLAHHLTRGKAFGPTTAANSSDGCSGFSRAFCLLPLAFFSRDLASIELP